MAYAGASTTALRDQITRLLVECISGLPVDEARELTAAFAGHGRGAGPLRDYLLDHSRVLSTSDSDIPLALVEIAHALHRSGRTDIVLPACVDCGATPSMRNVVPGGRICNTCLSRRRRVRCTRCDKPTGASKTVTAAGGLCQSCRAATKPAEACATCHRPAKIQQRLPDGTGLCQRCATRPTKPCGRCGRDRPVHANTSDGPVCAACHQRPVHPCGRCGRIAKWHTRPRDGQPGYCIDCHQRPVAACTRCGNIRPLSRSTQHDDALMCDLCRARQQPCDLCHRTSRIVALWPIGAACTNCYQRIRRTAQPCPTCGHMQPLIGLSVAGERICAKCANLDHDYTCARCGTAGQFPVERTCYACLARDRLDDLIGVAATPRTNLNAFVEAILASGTGEAVWQRLAPGRATAKLIVAIATAEPPPSHDLLDTLPHGLALHRLRADLVHAGVLPDRAEYLDRIGPWLDHQLAGQPEPNSQLIRSWFQWTLQRRARHRLPRRPFTEGAAHYQRTILTAAIRFLQWTDEQHLTLATLSQPDIDRWLTDHPHEYAYQAKEFLRWARSRGLTGEIGISQRPQVHNPTALSEHEQWQYLRRCLSDASIPTDVRLAGSLNLLYGLTLARIARLRTDDVSTTPAGTHLALGNHQLRLADPVARLLQAHLDITGGQQWVFPGKQPGRHFVKLRQRLARHDLPDAAHGRAAALINLASSVPPPVLVDLLGISISAAQNWAKHAGSDWTAYLAART